MAGRVFNSQNYKSWNAAKTGRHLTEPITFDNTKMLNRKFPFSINDKVIYQGKNKTNELTRKADGNNIAGATTLCFTKMKH
jgi:hypothetical protein